ncbi:hypothetical protein K0M31_008975 [Melipona bicolor]|uniref:Uncharacterized protein n=1 Tax=Melipona bicolor TaxID=60889 RepID=A0AA40FNS0_9HYME|nr:hypothetical protein K0M31_008975 [Melipona bicolor]
MKISSKPDANSLVQARNQQGGTFSLTNRKKKRLRCRGMWNIAATLLGLSPRRVVAEFFKVSQPEENFKELCAPREKTASIRRYRGSSFSCCPREMDPFWSNSRANLEHYQLYLIHMWYQPGPDITNIETEVTRDRLAASCYVTMPTRIDRDDFNAHEKSSSMQREPN